MGTRATPQQVPVGLYSKSVEVGLSSLDRVVLAIVPFFDHHVDDQADGKQLLVPGRDADLTAPQEK